MWSGEQVKFEVCLGHGDTSAVGWNYGNEIQEKGQVGLLLGNQPIVGVPDLGVGDLTEGTGHGQPSNIC